MSTLADVILIEDDDAMDIDSDGHNVRAASPAVSEASTCTLRGSPEPDSLASDPTNTVTIQPPFTQSAQSPLRLLPATHNTPEVQMSGTADESTRLSNEIDHPRRRLYSLINDGLSFDNLEEIYDFLEVQEERGSLRAEVPQEAEVIDLEAAEAQAELEEQIANRRVFIQAASIPKRNVEVLPPFIEIGSVEWKPHQLLRPGKLVELTGDKFLLIKTMIKNLTDYSIRLRGWELKRTRDIGGLLRKKLNELVFIHEIDEDDDRPILEQSVTEVHLNSVQKIRNLVCTNRPFPECRFNPADVPPGTTAEMNKWVEDNGVLVARWSYISRYDNSIRRVQQDPAQSRKSAILRMLTKDECTKGEYVEPDVRKSAWRGETVLGGAARKSRRLRGALSIAEAECNRQERGRSVKRTYTFGDCYCGAGGMTCAAVKAGLKVLYGVDMNPDAGQTWQENFSPARFLEMSVHDFSVLPGPLKNFIVDILHLSPPCQMFSPVKTRPGQNDESNYASLFGVGEAIKKARPRIATLEQTFGIMAMKHTETFNALIGMFTDLQYDVSWEIKTFQSYGLPQSRKRLIIIASCPGETIPSFPAYTHYDPAQPSTRIHLNMKPYTTPESVLSLIPAHAPNHDPTSPNLLRAQYKPWDAHRISTCIMTSGPGSKGHPSGRRGLTNRELAQLQGVPLWMAFHGHHVRRQIGNMVPPMVGQILLESVRRHLKEAGRVQMERERSVVRERAARANAVIVLD